MMDENTKRCESLADYLRSEGFRVDAMQNGIGKLRELSPGRYDLIVIGFLRLSAGASQALLEIRAPSSIPIVMILGSGSSEDRIKALEMGVDDCLPEHFLPGELKARIHAVLRRAGPSGRERCSGAASRSTVVGDIEIHMGIRVAYLRGNPLSLTSLEFNVLEMLLRATGRIVSREEIAGEALGKSLGINDRSVDVHICSLRKKLGPLSGGLERIRAVRNRGYFYAPPFMGSFGGLDTHGSDRIHAPEASEGSPS